MNWLQLKDGSKWPDPNESSDSFNLAAKAYHGLILGGLSLQQVQDKVSLIRQAAGRPRVPRRKCKKKYKYKGIWYNWREIAEIGVDGLTRDVIESRRRAGWSTVKILFTPVRKLKKQPPKYGKFKSKADHDALHECNPEQLKILGI